MVGAVLAALVSLPSLVAFVPATAEAPEDLLQRVRDSQGVGWSGLGESTGTLALPDVRELSGLPELLGSTTRARVWWRGPTAYRVDVLTPVGEVDLVVDEAGSWTWASADRRAVRVQGDPAVRLPRGADLVAPLLGRRLARSPGVTPEPLAARRVAGVDAAGLRLVPAPGTASTVSRVDLWAEPRTGLVLRVEVAARGAARPVVVSELLDLDLRTPPLVRAAFAPPPVADVQVLDAPDVAAAIDRFAPYPLPGALAGQRRQSPVDALRSAGGVAVYGEGLGAFALLPLPRDVGRGALRRIDPADTDGRADVRTPLLNATVVRAGRGTFLLAGTVPPAVLDLAVAGLRADPPRRYDR